MTEIKIAVTDEDINSCWEAMSLLRPMLKEKDFIGKIRDMQKEGYVLLYLLGNGKAVSIAGYRFLTMLHCGKMLYIDDLSTLEVFRGRGYASILLNHIYEIAKQENCQSVQLDSGHTRTKAHKLYYKENFTINSFHFAKQL
jgi:GNAT superfamily N-acetyltransferase